MRDQLERRLEQLKKEFSAGRSKSMELEQQQAMLQQTLLRISGAIQVLEEELKAEDQPVTRSNRTTGDTAQAALSQVNGSREHVAP